MSNVIDEIRALIEAPCEALGYRIVQVQFYEPNNRRTLQIMAERVSDGGMEIKDCTQISHTVSAILDVQDSVEGAYHLEVSSPGIDRPLTRLADFETYASFDAKIETQLPIAGRRRFKGVVEGVDGEQVLLEVDGSVHKIDFNNISQAKLVLTDRLIKAHEAQQQAS
jgi:ribosome maturation factor RimP